MTRKSIQGLCFHPAYETDARTAHDADGKAAPAGLRASTRHVPRPRTRARGGAAPDGPAGLRGEHRAMRPPRSVQRRHICATLQTPRSGNERAPRLPPHVLQSSSHGCGEAPAPRSQPGREAQHTSGSTARRVPPQRTSTIYIVNEKSWRAESGTACLQRRRSYVRDVKHRSVRTEQRGGVFQRGSAHTAEPCPFLSSPLLSRRLPLTDGGRHGGGRRRRGAAMRGPLLTSG